jgi:hypothetical protein
VEDEVAKKNVPMQKWHFLFQTCLKILRLLPQASDSLPRNHRALEFLAIVKLNLAAAQS